MKKVVIILFIVGVIFTVGCKEVEKVECYNGQELNIMENTDIKNNDSMKDYGNIVENKDEIKVSIKSSEKSFYNNEVKFIPIIEGEIDKEVQYHWIFESKIYVDGKFYDEAEVCDEEDYVDGFASDKGLCREIINDGEEVGFGLYAEVSYVDGAYSEDKIILQIEEKESGNVLAKDELIIENRQGMYFVNTSEEEALKDEILKTEKARVYAGIFDIIWNFDTGLNPNGQYINVDTKSFENFTEEDKVQLFEYLSKKYNKTILDKTFEELEAEGYIKEMSFKDGMMFKANKYLKNSENEISFEGMKWVSGIGAIGFVTEAEKNDDRWIIKKCQMTWIS